LLATKQQQQKGFKKANLNRQKTAIATYNKQPMRTKKQQKSNNKLAVKT